MTAAVRTFKLPRKSLGSRKGRAHRMKTAPKSEWVEPDVTRPLDDWRHDAYAEAHARLPEGLGVDRPLTTQGQNIDPHLPPDITKLGSNQLGILHAQMVAMGEWLEWEVAKSDVLATNQSAYLDHLKAEIRLGKSGTVKDKDSKTINDVKYVPEVLKDLQVNARTKLLKSRLRGYEKCAAALSREMTRRTEPTRAGGGRHV